MPSERSAGKPTTRRYSDAEKRGALGCGFLGQRDEIKPRGRLPRQTAGAGRTPVPQSTCGARVNRVWALGPFPPVAPGVPDVARSRSEEREQTSLSWASGVCHMHHGGRCM